MIALLALVAVLMSPAAVQPCTASRLSGTFAFIPGSPGAGSVSYLLRLRNRSSNTCFVSGLTQLRLLTKTGRPLPTRAVPAFRPGLTAVRVVLRPGRSAKAEARFSPDIPGPGEPQTRGPCEPKAYKVRITPPPGGGMLVGPVTPPTSVCEHGTISLKTLSPG